jgi:formylglycine-generating enzyme required for sulfatase activity
VFFRTLIDSYIVKEAGMRAWSSILIFCMAAACSDDTDSDIIKESIGSQGGMLRSADGKATLEIPMGAVDKDIEFSIGTAVNVPKGIVGVGYDIGPTGIVFNQPAKLTISYDASALGGADEAQLSISVEKGGAWDRISSSTVDQASDKVSAQLKHLSVYGVVRLCGNGVLDSGEECDGSKSGKTCADAGYDSGSPACTSCTLDLSGCKLSFKPVVAGTFTMGSPTDEPCRSTNETLHEVTLTRPFEIGEGEVSQGAYKDLMGYNPSSFPDCGLDCPVEWLSWHEAAAFCTALSKKEGLEPCYDCIGNEAEVRCSDAKDYTGANIYACPGYRLPTQAEWEYAYRAGTSTAFYNGPNVAEKCPQCPAGDPNANAIGWYNCNASDGTQKGKQKAANAWGLYDMAGNVSEWTHDRHQIDLGSAAVTDPWGADTGTEREVRGGGYSNCSCALRAAARPGATVANTRGSHIGFRCVKTK